MAHLQNTDDLKLKSRLGNVSGMQVPDSYFNELSESIWLRIGDASPRSIEIKIEEHGFQVPDGAMDDLTQRILDKISENPEDLKISGLTNDSGFTVPELYFETNKIAIPAQLPVRRIKPLWQKYISIAAMVVLGIGITWWVQPHGSPQPAVAVSVPTPAIDSLTNEEIIPVLNEYELDEEVYAFAAQIPEQNIEQAPALKDSASDPEEHIEEYLIEHIDELDEI